MMKYLATITTILAILISFAIFAPKIFKKSSESKTIFQIPLFDHARYSQIHDGSDPEDRFGNEAPPYEEVEEGLGSVPHAEQSELLREFNEDILNSSSEDDLARTNPTPPPPPAPDYVYVDSNPISTPDRVTQQPEPPEQPRNIVPQQGRPNVANRASINNPWVFVEQGPRRETSHFANVFEQMFQQKYIMYENSVPVLTHNILSKLLELSELRLIRLYVQTIDNRRLAFNGFAHSDNLRTLEIVAPFSMIMRKNHFPNLENLILDDKGSNKELVFESNHIPIINKMVIKMGVIASFEYNNYPESIDSVDISSNLAISNLDLRFDERYFRTVNLRCLVKAATNVYISSTFDKMIHFLLLGNIFLENLRSLTMSFLWKPAFSTTLEEFLRTAPNLTSLTIHDGNIDTNGGGIDIPGFLDIPMIISMLERPRGFVNGAHNGSLDTVKFTGLYKGAVKMKTEFSRIEPVID